MTAAIPLEIAHDTAQRSFVARVDGHRCVLDYRLDGRTMTITHTGVPGAVGGRGIASELVKAAALAARAVGWKVVPACSYADTWFERNRAYADVLVDA